jgi:hypothetical protein
MRIKPTLLISCVLVAAPALSFAQAPPTPATPPAQTAPPHSGTATPEGQTTGQRTEPLGDRLSKSDGVLCPPSGVDPEIRAPTPEGGSTPVIPPPGSPGGDPSVRPK